MFEIDNFFLDHKNRTVWVFVVAHFFNFGQATFPYYDIVYGGYTRI